jgi:crossover junction endodeoxyribonuclease RusA
MITIRAYCTPQPQGSARAFIRNGRANITSDNKKLKPFRSEVTSCAIDAMQGHMMFAKHAPVKLYITFLFRKPESVSKKRTFPVVKPDLDKLLRATLDALTGVVFHDDAQVVEVVTSKIYSPIEGVNITATEAA